MDTVDKFPLILVLFKKFLLTITIILVIWFHQDIHETFTFLLDIYHNQQSIQQLSCMFSSVLTWIDKN